MKRLYLRDEFRGSGLGKMLIEKVIKEARLISTLSILRINKVNKGLVFSILRLSFQTSYKNSDIEKL